MSQSQKTFEVTAPDGRVFEVSGDRMPTETELRQIFSTMGAEKGATPRSVRQPGAATMGEVLQAKPEGSASWRFASNLGEVLNPISMAKGVYHAATSPIDTAKGMYAAQSEQFDKAAAAYRDGRYSEMVGHGAASLLPLLGPQAAQAGEQIGSGDIAGGLGRTAGILAPFGVKGAVDAVRGASAAKHATKADYLERQATAQVAKDVLAPANPRYRGPAHEIAPELLKRGVRGDHIQLGQWADNLIGESSQMIDAAWDALPDTYRAPTKPILDRLDAKLSEMEFVGPPSPRGPSRAPVREVNPAKRAEYDSLKELRDFVGRRGSSLSKEDVRALRAQFDDASVEQGALVKASGDAKVGASGKANLTTANSFRQQIAEDIPELVQANADMHLGLTLKDILDPTKGRPTVKTAQSGVTGGLSTAGAIIGSKFGAIGAFLVSDLLPRIRNAQLSPQNQMRLAQDKFKLAQALREGNQGMAQKIALNMTAYLPKGEQATRLAENRTPSQ